VVDGVRTQGGAGGSVAVAAEGEQQLLGTDPIVPGFPASKGAVGAPPDTASSGMVASTSSVARGATPSSVEERERQARGCRCRRCRRCRG
jgi:hypothetical protein